MFRDGKVGTRDRVDSGAAPRGVSRPIQAIFMNIDSVGLQQVTRAGPVAEHA
jgi:hypothetical protein